MSRPKAKIKNSKQEKSEKQRIKYKIKNWSAYNRALINRGNITLYFDMDLVNHWYARGPKKRGGQKQYSDCCIEAILMIKVVFGLGYRQVEGFAKSILYLLELSSLPVPCYTQLHRRARQLEVVPFSIPSSGPIILVIDSTGIKVHGEGEWKIRKHGYTKRRVWRKLHLGVDSKTGFIHCHSLTTNSQSDATQLEPLLDQVHVPIEQSCLDGAYDKRVCWKALMDRNIKPTIPPTRGAAKWHRKKSRDWSEHPRNQAIDFIENHSRKEWKVEDGYHQRSLAESAMYRYKIIYGAKFYSRKFGHQQVENDLKIKLLNIMVANGMPISIPCKVA